MDATRIRVDARNLAYDFFILSLVVVVVVVSLAVACLDWYFFFAPSAGECLLACWRFAKPAIVAVSSAFIIVFSVLFYGFRRLKSVQQDFKIATLEIPGASSSLLLLLLLLFRR